MKSTLQTILAITLFFFSKSINAQVAPSIEWQKSLGGTSEDYAHSIRQTTDGGFIVAGASYSADGDLSGNQGVSDYWIVKLDASGNLVWQKSFGGIGFDEAYSVQQITDGGFIIAGFSSLDDYWIVKLDTDGNFVWQKSWGGSSFEEAHSIQQTADGGFIVAGYSSSNDGDVSGHHGCSNDVSFNCRDYWVVKLDTVGNLVWQKSLGGSEYDWAYSVRQTTDGGFIVAGHSETNDGDVTGNHGGPDYWIVKLDAAGNLEWEKSFGGSDFDEAYSVQQTSDGGYIVAGGASSNDGDVAGHYGNYDYWVLKLDINGNLVWQKSLAGGGDDLAYSVQQTNDGGFIVTGVANSADGEVSGNHGGFDYWIVKLDVTGNLVWQKSMGGSSTDFGRSVQQTSDGGYIVAGWSNSNDGDVSGNHGNFDYWIVKLTSDTLTGIASISNNFISIYPNPVQTQLTINLSSPTDDFVIHIYDLEGRMKDLGIGNWDFGLNHSIQLNTENLPDGFYTLQIINNKTGEIEVGKFVKEN